MIGPIAISIAGVAVSSVNGIAMAQTRPVPVPGAPAIGIFLLMSLLLIFVGTVSLLTFLIVWIFWGLEAEYDRKSGSDPWGKACLVAVLISGFIWGIEWETVIEVAIWVTKGLLFLIVAMLVIAIISTIFKRD